MISSLISLHDPKAARAELVGGKACNLHELLELNEQLKEADRTIRQAPGQVLFIPRAYVVTTEVFSQLVLARPSIEKKILQLEEISKKLASADPTTRDTMEPNVRELSGELRAEIGTISLPQSLCEHVACLFRLIRSDVAVRSSATVEDRQTAAAAGMGATVLHVRSEQRLWEAIRTVWASLFSDKFLFYRIAQGIPQVEARMAIIIQEMVDAVAAGVAFSLTPYQRPAIVINANLGLGDAVMEGRGQADRWIVGPDARFIVERNIVPKASPHTERLEASELPSMNDAQVLELAQQVGRIRDHYRIRGLARHVDVEFALDAMGQLCIVQARPETTTSRESASNRLHFLGVDQSKLPPDARAFGFPRALLAQLGAATGVLQILGDEDYENVQPNAILLVRNTTNRWDAAFHKLAGVIACAGNDSSHAALTTRELRIPCLVGAADAWEQLRPYNGCIVTLDTHTQTLYLGKQTLASMEVDLSIWANEQELDNAAMDELQNSNNPLNVIKHELDPNRLRTLARVDSAFDGIWLAKPDKLYSFFQLDFYRRAWQRLPCLLAEIFPHRFGNRSVAAELTEACVIRRGILCLEIGRTANGRTLDFLLQLTPEELERLTSLRWQAFEQLETQALALPTIDAESAHTIVQILVELLAWQHLSIPLSNCVEGRIAYPQLRYISPTCRPAFEHVMLQQLGPQKDRNEDQKRDREVYGIAESIRGDKVLIDLLAGSNELAHIEDQLRRANLELYQKIVQLSRRYKKASEDLRTATDTIAYLRELRELISCDACSFGERKARLEIQSPVALHSSVDEALRSHQALNRALSLSVQTARLRNHGHHVVVRAQRHVAALMRQSTARFAVLLGNVESVFELSTEEFVALHREGDPSYLVDSFRWRQQLQHAESTLEAAWPTDCSEAVSAYSQVTEPVLTAIRRQREAATYEGVIRYYDEEIARAQYRVVQLQELATHARTAEHCVDTRHFLAR